MRYVGLVYKVNIYNQNGAKRAGMEVFGPWFRGAPLTAGQSLVSLHAFLPSAQLHEFRTVTINWVKNLNTPRVSIDFTYQQLDTFMNASRPAPLVGVPDTQLWRP